MEFKEEHKDRKEHKQVPKYAPRPGASAWQAGCCTLDRKQTHHMVSANRRITGGVFVEAEDLPASPGPWQGWLQDWEARQRELLHDHQEALRAATTSCVFSLKAELMERLERLERPSATARGKRPGRGKISDEDGTASEKTACENRISITEQAMRAEGFRSPMSPAKKGGNNKKMNDAITGVIGGNKERRMQDNCASLYSEDFKEASGLTFGEGSQELAPPNKYRALIWALVHHRFFNATSGFLVMMYAMAAGIMSDIEMRSALGKTDVPGWRPYMDLTFTIIFILEFSLKLTAEGRRFFRGKERTWNIFDMVVALSGLLDIIHVSKVSFGFLRVLRTFRAIRVLRIMRILSFFKDLRLMVASILCCLLSLTSAFTLLIAVMYIFAVILLQSAAEFLRDKAVPPEVEELLSESFGNMLRTVYSLSQAVSGGRSWGEFAAPFIKINAWYGLLFTLFVAFVIFGVLNILTGVFVESTSSLASVDKELVIQEQLARNQSLINQIRKLFKEIDVDGSGTLSYQELKRNLRDERVKAYFSVLQMDVSEAHGLFQLLDRDESGEVSIEEFIMTCLRLKGAARSLDLATMLAENKRLHQVLKNLSLTIEESFDDIHTRLKSIQSWQDEAIVEYS